MSSHIPKPHWLRRRLICSETSAQVSGIISAHNLHTVCQSARCPNQGECFSAGTAAFLILGDRCTRRCAFCAVSKAPPLPPDSMEPESVGDSAEKMKLEHVVITSVTRDDLKDRGLEHYARTVSAVRRRLPGSSIEILTPDFFGAAGAWERIAEMKVDVFDHNMEVVPRLYQKLRPGADWNRSLELLRQVSRQNVITKTGLMLGLGEKRHEVEKAFKEIRNAGVAILTLGQYLQPAMENFGVVEYIHPEAFDAYRETALTLGFSYVASGPFIRSSYKAREAFCAALAGRRPHPF